MNPHSIHAPRPGALAALPGLTGLALATRPSRAATFTQVALTGGLLSATCPSVAGRTCSLDPSGDLHNRAGASSAAGTGGPVTLTFGPATDLPRLFVRVQVTFP